MAVLFITPARPWQAWHRRFALIAAGVLAAGVSAWFLLSPAVDASPTALQSGPVLGAAPGVPAAFVKSQEGTQPDGKLAMINPKTAGDDQSPLAYGELRRLFDYYLSAQGEQSLPSITQQIQSELDRGLGELKGKRARRLLDQYLSFKRALVDLEAKPALAGGGVALIRQRMEAQQELRNKHFARDEIEGMFGMDDLMDRDAVDRLEISQNPKLTAAQKQQQLSALDAAMAPALRADRDATSAISRVEENALELRAKGASEDEIYRMRAKEFDANAANRLAELDREEAAWKQRITLYLNARNQLLSSPTPASASERQQALAALQQSQFSESERRRLAAYEVN